MWPEPGWGLAWCVLCENAMCSETSSVYYQRGREGGAALTSVGDVNGSPSPSPSPATTTYNIQDVQTRDTAHQSVVQFIKFSDFSPQQLFSPLPTLKQHPSYLRQCIPGFSVCLRHRLRRRRKIKLSFNN